MPRRCSLSHFSVCSSRLEPFQQRTATDSGAHKSSVGSVQVCHGHRHHGISCGPQVARGLVSNHHRGFRFESQVRVFMERSYQTNHRSSHWEKRKVRSCLLFERTGPRRDGGVLGRLFLVWIFRARYDRERVPRRTAQAVAIRSQGIRQIRRP